MNKYFAYGVNLNEDRFRGRCPSIKFISKAILEDYEYTFPRRHRNWEGGVAGVSKKLNSIVEGVIYTISDTDMKKLDEIENIPGGEYTREKVTVTLKDNSTDMVWIYIPCPDEKKYYKPSQEYIEKIVEGAKRHNLSNNFIAMLKSHL